MRRVALYSVIATLVVCAATPWSVEAVEAPDSLDAAPTMVTLGDEPTVVVDGDESTRAAPWSPPIRCTILTTQFLAATDLAVGVIAEVGLKVVHSCTAAPFSPRGPPAP